MVAKSIVDIDVNDDKFVAFMERFREYQSALDDLITWLRLRSKATLSRLCRALSGWGASS